MTRKRKVLIVEDDMDILDLIAFNLSRHGFATEAALDGSNGLEKTLEFEPDLVILDLMLPGVDGWELCRRLKDSMKDIKVLMLSAKSMDEDRARGLEAGADDYMTKPFVVKELLARTRSLLSMN